LTDPVAFILASLALLATPGPTNALLATSSAAAGFVRSLVLIPAVVAGYALSILLVGLVIAPLLASSKWLDAGLRIACAVYLAYAAWRLWREAADGRLSGEPVAVSRIFIATLLNPKGLVFALAIVPFLKDGDVGGAAPYLGGLLVMAAGVSLIWSGAGAFARRTAGARSSTSAVRKTGASVLVIFGLLMAGSVVAG
jgi:threonine/homoserine/homoserine lactone efflux protein